MINLNPPPVSHAESCPYKDPPPAPAVPIGIRILVSMLLHVPPISKLRFWTSEGLTQQKLNLEGWKFQAHRGLPGKLESKNISRDNLSREFADSRPCSRAASHISHRIQAAGSVPRGNRRHHGKGHHARLCFQHLCLPFRPLPYLTWPITCRNSTGLHDWNCFRLPRTRLPFQKQSPA